MSETSLILSDSRVQNFEDQVGVFLSLLLARVGKCTKPLIHFHLDFQDLCGFPPLHAGSTQFIWMIRYGLRKTFEETIWWLRRRLMHGKSSKILGNLLRSSKAKFV